MRPHSTIPLSERFWAKVDKNGPVPAHRPELGPCWLWTGSKDEHGYGRLQRRTVSPIPLRAHRVAYELTYGPVPDELDICHSCDNPPCVNPTHLFTGTKADNQQDMSRKHRDRWPSKLTETQALAIRSERTTLGSAYKTIAKRYGVSIQTVCDIIKCRTWNRC